MTSPFLVTSADKRPLEVPSQLTSLFLKLKPDMVFYNKKDNTIHLVELTVPFENNIQKAHDRKAQKYRDLVSDILDNGFICDLTCFEIGSRGLITPENIRNIDKIFSFVNTKPSKSFRKELSKVALLPSYAIWNARQESAWGSENQPLFSAWFSFHLGLPSVIAGFISEFLCLSPAVVVWNVFFVCTALRRSEPLGSLLVLDLNVLPFVMHFALVVCHVWIKVDITTVKSYPIICKKRQNCTLKPELEENTVLISII